MIAVFVTGANVDDGTAAPTVLAQVSPTEFPRLKTIIGDNKYHNNNLANWLEKERADWNIEVKPRPKQSKGFVPVQKRWTVERSHAWHGRFRRNSKDYERRPESPSQESPRIQHYTFCPPGATFSDRCLQQDWQ